MKVRDYLYSYYLAQNFVIDADVLDNSDPIAFIADILGLEPAKHHRQWIEAIVTGENSAVLSNIAGDNLRISAPRGSAKTTVISALLAWIIGHNPAIRIILCAYAEDVALNISVAIKSIIESEKYFRYFPNIKKSRRWRDTSWTIDREYAGVVNPIKDATLYAVGATGAIASRRADLIVIDDPIRSSKDIANPQVRKDMVRWWSEVLSPTLVPGGRTLVLCTRYRVDDLHGTTFNENNNWQVINHKAIVINDDGMEDTFWDYMPLEFLKKKREEDPIAFASQYQNDPLQEDNQIISADWIKRDRVPDYFREIAVGIDLAASEKTTADYNSYVTVGILGDRYFVLECNRGRWSLSEFIEILCDLYLRYRDSCDRFSFQVESIAYQVAFVREFKRVVNEKRLLCRVQSVKLKGDKLARLFGISGLFESGKVVFSDVASMGLLIEEVINFGVTAHDDLVDAMVHSLTRLYKISGRSQGGTY